MNLVHVLTSYLTLLLLLLLLLYNLMYSISVLRSFTVAFCDDILFYVRCLYHRVSLGGPNSRVIWTTPSPIHSGRPGANVVFLCNGITLWITW